MRLYRPGIIPLHPLRLGDIFNGALTTIRRNPEATLGLSLLVLAGVLIPSFLGTVAVFRWAPLDSADLEVIALAIPSLATGVATLALSGFVIHVVSQAALGDKVGIGATWRAVRSRLLSLLGATVITVLALVLAFTLAIVVIVLLATTTGGGTGSAVIGVILVFATLPFALWIFIRLSLAPAVVVLERAGPLRAVVRAWRLTPGRQAWRVLGIYLLSSLVAGLVGQAISTPLVLASSAAASGMTGTAADLVLAGGYHLSTLLANALVTPFLAGVIALLYLDMRFRFEGLDTTMMQTVERRAAQRRETGG